MKCRECSEPIHRGEPYRLIHVPGGRKPGSTYHHEYAHHDCVASPSVAPDSSSPTHFLQWTDAVAERMRLCLEACEGVRTEDLREIVASGGLKSLL